MNDGMMRAHSKPASPRGARPARAEDAKMLLLIEAAEDIFLAKGYHSATMSDVAKAAGMSKKTVYQLISSKADLFVALLAHYQSLLTFPTAQPGWTTHTFLVENLLCLAKFVLAPDQIAIIRLIMAEYTHSPDLGRTLHRNRYKKAKSKLESCLRELTTTQNLKLASVSEMSAMLFGMAIGEFHISVLIGFRAPPSTAALEKRIRNAVDIFLAGCGCGTDVLRK
jgi:AcrR family transcriptional regulator